MRGAHRVLGVVFLLGLAVSGGEIIYAAVSGLTGHGGWRGVLYGMFGAWVCGLGYAQHRFTQVTRGEPGESPADTVDVSQGDPPTRSIR